VERLEELRTKVSDSELELEQLSGTVKLELVGGFPGLKQNFLLFLALFEIFENSNHHRLIIRTDNDKRRLQTACDENVITNNNLLSILKSVCDGLYKPLVIGPNVVVWMCS
jgi:hypothetical protein